MVLIVASFLFSLFFGGAKKSERKIGFKRKVRKGLWTHQRIKK